MKLSRTALIFLILTMIWPAGSTAGIQRERAAKPTAPQRMQPTGTLNAEIATAINELLKLEPLRDESYSVAVDSSDAEGEQVQPPADDAPLKELIAYWRQHNAEEPGNPSDRVRQRLLEACEARPWLLRSLLRLLPGTDDAKDRLFNLYQNEPDENAEWRGQLREWLKYNSRHFLDELRTEAQQAVAAKVENSTLVYYLARLDWETAKPLLEASQNLLELAILFEQAAAHGETALAERCRLRLQNMVNDRNAEGRLFALQSLLQTEWPGQEEWFSALFADSSLTGAEGLLQARRALEEEFSQQAVSAGKEPTERSYRNRFAMALARMSDKGASQENLLAVTLNANTKRLVPAVVKLVNHSDRQVHNAAVEALNAFLASSQRETDERQLTARALTPWLADAQWSDSFSRLTYLGILSKLKVPESVPGLIAVLDNDPDPLARAAAAEALCQLRPAGAVPALRRALEREEDEALRESLVTGLFLCGGVTDEEAAAAIEAYARKLSAPGGEAALTAAKEGGEPLPLQVSIGRILHESERLAATEGLAALLFARVKALRPKQPAVAQQILRIIEGAPLPIAQQFLAQRIGASWVDVGALTLALENRAEMQKNAGGEWQPLLNRGGYSAGVAAIVLNDADAARTVLKSKDAKAQLALLACARYLRAALPVELIAGLLADKALASAAESYLITEDSAAARQLVWARHPGEALILGAPLPHAGRVKASLRDNATLEEKLRRELLAPSAMPAKAITEIYALFAEHQIARWVIRVRDGQAEFRKYTDHAEARWYARTLTPGELAELRAFAARPEVADLKSPSELEDIEQGVYEYLQLTHNGGRRILTSAPQRVRRGATLHEELSGLFYHLSNSGEYKVHYAIEEQLPGVEVVLADTQNWLTAVCQEGSEIRVFSIMREAPRFAQSIELQPEWRAVVNGQLGALADEPAACRFSLLRNALQRLRRAQLAGQPFMDNSAVSPDGTFVFARAYGDDPGIWHALPGGDLEKLLDGRFSAPLLTPDGQWLLAVKANSAGGGSPSQLIRYNLKTQRETVVSLPKGAQLQPLAYLAAHGKVLLGQSRSSLAAPSVAAQQSQFLLDPNTGAWQPVQGDFRPLGEPALLPRQVSDKPHEWWVALPEQAKKGTVIGHYDTRKFVFHPVLTLPGLHLRSDEMWVETAANRLWLIYEGHLLKLPLPPAKPS